MRTNPASTTIHAVNDAKSVNKKPFILVVVEGNISAGKTTLIPRISDALLKTHNIQSLSVAEPKSGYIPYLAEFYKEPAKYIHKLQHWFMAQRLEMFVRLMNQVERDRNIECVIFDRCIHSDAVFLKNAFNSGLMTKEEYDSFMAVREIVQRDMPKPTLIIDLRVSPQECFRRVHHVRKESSESPMTLEYLEAIDLCYQEYYNLMRDAHGIEVFSISWENFGKSTPELNVSTEYTDMVDFTRMVDKIKEVIRAKQRED